MNTEAQFDVFLAHNSLDKAEVKVIHEKLKSRGLNPWLDDEQIRAGQAFQDVIQEAIPLVKSAAIFIGLRGLGRWQILELRAFIEQCVERNISVIPVLLPGVEQIPEQFVFLKQFKWVSFSQRIDDERELDSLEWGIRHKKPEREYIKQIRFISELKTRLIKDKEVYNLSRNKEFADFDFIGYQESSITVDLVAFAKADGLNERQIVELRDKFFESTQIVAYDFGLRPVTRMPNSLLGFVFEDGCPSYLIDFIKKQTQISHWGKSAVLVSWVIDVKHKQIHTHKNPVSLIPPVVILEGSVFPGLDYLKSFLYAYNS